MTEATLTFLLTHVLPPLLIAVLTAILTVHLSLRRFHAERWWERKVDAYSRIIEALHHAAEYCDAQSDEHMGVTEMTTERSNELLTNYRAACADLRKATSIGAYIISDEVAELLVRLESRRKLKWEDTGVVEMFDAEVRAYREALTQMRRLARENLRVS